MHSYDTFQMIRANFTVLDEKIKYIARASTTVINYPYRHGNWDFVVQNLDKVLAFVTFRCGDAI